MSIITLQNNSCASVPVKKKKEPSTPREISSAKCVHLFYRESKKYFCAFIDLLTEKSSSKETKLKLKSIKDVTLSELERFYRRDEEAPLDRAAAYSVWADKKEEKRQSAITGLFKRAMYRALSFFDKPEKVHKKTCLEIAALRREELVYEKKTDVASKFALETPTGKLSAQLRTRQYGRRGLTSLDARTEAVPVNMHREEVVFTKPNGETISSVQLRTGSFDFPSIPESPPLIESPKISLDAKTKALMEKNLDRFIKRAPKNSVQDLNNLIALLSEFMLTLPEGKKQSCMRNIEQCKNELARMLRNRDIIAANAACIEDLFRKVARDADKGKMLGMVLPQEVKELFAKDELLSGQNWGMISLQTPLNVTAGKDYLSRLILSLARSKVLPSFIRSLFKKLADNDLSELDSIYREMKGFSKARKKATGLVKNAVYFNIPTNFVGSRVQWRLGSLKYSTSLNEHLIKSEIDRRHFKKIQEENSQSTEKIFKLAQHAMQVLSEAIQKESSLSKREVLQRHLNSIRCLTGQVFEVSNGKIHLAIAPSRKAQYEIPARLTILMQLIGFNTTGHCRSGNNRTAAWLAKSHQIFGNLAASPDGRIDGPRITAGKVARLPQDHWSKEIYLQCFSNSLVLQQANKGTQGTKLDMPEVPEKTLQRALFRGAFDLAGRFEEDELTKALLVGS